MGYVARTGIPAQKSWKLRGFYGNGELKFRRVTNALKCGSEGSSKPHVILMTAKTRRMVSKDP